MTMLYKQVPVSKTKAVLHFNPTTRFKPLTREPVFISKTTQAPCLSYGEAKAAYPPPPTFST